MKLYAAPGACSLASNIALHEAGIKFDLAKVDLRTKKVEGTDYSQVSSKGYVPALRLDDGQVLTENVVVLQYIADLNPAAKLAPACGTIERYRLQEWLSFINSEIHKSFGPLFNVEAKDEVKQYALNLLRKRLGWLQSAMESRKFLMGEQFTVADAYLFTVLGWGARVGVDIGQWPVLKSYLDRIAARPQVIEAMTLEGLIKK